ncbi:M48 family metalloprotease [Streptomyces purpurogeneiscleroticus]|uniref:M48 family metalloprotease n=1 Tax=Streptomyces purpurogeneiscleroticus TaxID=68259 RepID=UPI001CC13AFE|nr:M48 family metalloprotease [Streptomyces purpurogeneiscleroticus]MBZ4018585.1 hypothetical protein [Streptomyces purpurogeneiscleroticus]
MRSRFAPDRQLTTRMVLTMFLLGLVYVAFIAALIVLLKSVVLVVVIAAGLLGVQYWYSDRIALYAMHGRLVTREEQPQLHGVIDRLCATADMPEPRVAQLFGGRNRDQNTAALLAIVMAVSALVYVISFLLIRALSRYRELAADRAGAMLTGRPSALASALTKVSGDVARIPTRDLRTAQAFNAFFFTPALGTGTTMANLFSTHPSLERRLEALAELSVRLGGTA